MRKKTVLFCGHHSRYALAHLDPILSAPEFDVQQIIFASPSRYEIFREATAPDEFFTESFLFRARFKNQLRRLRERLQKRGIWRNNYATRSSIRGIPVTSVDDANNAAFVRKLRGYEPEIILSAAYPQIFSREVIQSASDLSINFHPSALPRCRGAHPHFWSIAMGEKFSGVSAHLLTEQLDAGDIVAQRIFRIDHLNYNELYERIVTETPALVREVAEFVISDQRRTVPQNHSQASYFRNERLMHRRIFWKRQTAQEIENLSRTGVAFCFLHEKRHLVISEARAISQNRNLHGKVDVEPGTIVDLSSGAIIVKTIDQCVEIRNIREKDRTIPLRKWIRRRSVQIGMQLA
jgi:methionyl-tRNA formyltransferase